MKQMSRLKKNLATWGWQIAAALLLLAGLLTCASRTQSQQGMSASDPCATRRTGIWVMQRIPHEPAEVEAFERRILSNSGLSGVALGAGWDELEEEPGQYRFEELDRVVSILRRAGMKYKLGVKPGTSTPGYVYRLGAAAFRSTVVNPHRPNFGQEVSLPLPWDPIYQERFSALIRALGERYSGDPLCVSVALTCANFMSGEMHLPKRPEDMARWRSYGDFRGKLLEVYRKYTDEWARAFPTQEICLHLSPVLHLKPSELVEPVIEYGLARCGCRFAVQTCSLSGRREDAGKEAYDIILKYKDRVHHGFQSVASFLTQPDRMGSPEMAALNVVHAEGSFWELWRGDGMDVETMARVARVWEEARKMGYDAYKAKLIAEGAYRRPEDDRYPPGRPSRRRQDPSETEE